MAEFEGSNKRIAKNSLFLYARMAVTMLLSLLTARIVLRALGEVDFGIFNIVSGCVTMFTFLNGALSSSAGRFITFELGRKDMKALNKSFNASIVVHIVLALIIVVLSETVGLWLLADKLIIPENRMFSAQWAYQISILVVVINILQVPFGALVVAHERFNVYAYLSIFDVGMRLMLILLLKTIPCDKLILWSLMTMGSSFIYAGFYVIYCRRSFVECRLRPHKDVGLYKKMLSYSSWNVVSGLSGMLQNQGMSIVLNLFFGPAIIAARGISYQVQGIISQFSGNFTAASNPQIIKYYAANKIEEMMNLVFFSGCLAFYLSWLFTLPVCLELNFVLKLWLGSFPDYTISFTVLTLVLGLIFSIKTSRVAAVSATGKLKAINLCVCSILCLSFPLGYICLKIGLQPYWVWIITIIVTLIGEVFASIILRRYVEYSVRDYWLNVYGRCTLVAVVSLLIPLFLHFFLSEGFLRLVIVSGVSVLSTGVTVYYIGVNRADRTIFNIYLNKYLSSIKSKLRFAIGK